MSSDEAAAIRVVRAGLAALSEVDLDGMSDAEQLALLRLVHPVGVPVGGAAGGLVRMVIAAAMPVAVAVVAITAGLAAATFVEALSGTAGLRRRL
jgi:hypothetical protein